MMSQPVDHLTPSDDDVSKNAVHSEEGEDPYFSSYGHFSIHEEMLKVHLL